MFDLCDKTFYLARIGLVRAGCPQELMGRADNTKIGAPIIIIKNPGRLGFVEATRYCPTGVIVAGARTRSDLLEHGFARSWAYVEAGAVEINADDAIGCSELMSKLDNLLLEKFYGGAARPVSGQPWPMVCEVYPFENYLIYSMKGQKYRQGFNLDPMDRKVVLKGGSTMVNEKFVDAGSIGDSMPRVQTGVRYAYAPVMGNVQSYTQGAKNSELVTQIIRNWGNILEAVSMYLNYVRLTGLPNSRPWQTPISTMVTKMPLTADHKVAAVLAANGIDRFDFARWSAMAFAEAKAKGTKKVGSGESVPRSQFAYVGDKNDPSTWHLPIHDAKHARLAVGMVSKTKGIPQSAKPGVLNKVRKAAKTKGVSVGNKTGKQKKWVKGGMAGIMPPSMPTMTTRGRSTSIG